MKYSVLVTIAVFFLPLCARANVAISEIAWMGSSVSANHEWIEFHNSGSSAVNVDGWTLSDSNTLLIELSGSIEAGKYAVIERTSDESASGAAFMIYTGALVNTGTTLTLRDGGGAIIDQVSGGENWESVGGNNTSKDTAQYSGTKWVTAPATPGRVNATVSNEQPTTSSNTSNTPHTGSTNLLKPAEKATTKLELANVTLALTIEAPEVVYAGQRIPLSVSASGPNQVVLDSLQFEWNFGDMATGGGRRTSHRYRFPGEYVITVYGAYGRHEQVARKNVTVLPVTLSITTDAEGNTQINNDAAYEVFLGGYALTGKETLIFPERTVLLPRASITVAKERLGSGYGDIVALRDAAGKLVADTTPNIESFDEMTFAAAEFEEDVGVPLIVSEATTEPEARFTFAEPILADIVSVAEAAEPEEKTLLLAEHEPPSASPSDDRTFLGLLILVTVATTALYFGHPPKKQLTE